MHSIQRDDVPVKKGLIRMFLWQGELHWIDPKNPADYEIE